MIILLHGEDVYQSRQKLNQIVDKFKSKDPSNMNLIFWDGAKSDFSEFKKNILSSPFMGDKRLIVIEDLLSQRKESLLDEALKLMKKGIPQSSVLVFWQSNEFDKRKKLAKYVLKNSQSEEFKFLTGVQLNSWIKKEVDGRGGKISVSGVDMLASYVGSDLWQMSNEIDKLIAYSKKSEISKEDVELLVKAKLDTNIFSFIDAIGKKNKKGALKLLGDQLESGENILYLLSMINYQFRNLLIIKSLLDDGYNQYNIGKEVKMHPFVIKKTVQQSHNYSLEYLKLIYQKILDLDAAIKTGRINSELGLDLLVIGLCG